MKDARILRAIVGVGATVGFGAHAALLGLGQYQSGPYYSDFDSTQITTVYTYNGNNTGSFTISNTEGAHEHYTDGSSAPGTLGSYPDTAFMGSYSLTAQVAFNSTYNQWEVTGGSFTIKGNLLTSSTSDILLEANLKTGINTLGFNGTNGKELDFLFTAPTAGEQKILEDFELVSAASTIGGIIVDIGTGSEDADPFNASFTSANGTVDTFVPEPGAYSFVGAGVALMALVLGRKRIGRNAI